MSALQLEVRGASSNGSPKSIKALALGSPWQRIFRLGWRPLPTGKKTRTSTHGLDIANAECLCNDGDHGLVHPFASIYTPALAANFGITTKAAILLRLQVLKQILFFLHFLNLHFIWLPPTRTLSLPLFIFTQPQPHLRAHLGHITAAVLHNTPLEGLLAVDQYSLQPGTQTLGAGGGR